VSAAAKDNGDPQRRRELAAIHAGRKALAIEEESYRALLERVTGRRSARDLDAAGRSAVIGELRRLGFQYQPGARKRPIAAPATAALAAKALALWFSLDQLGELRSGSAEAFRAFARRQTRVERTEWLTVAQWNDVVEALKAWCARVGFDQPDAERIAAIDASRAHVGLPAGGAGFAAKVHLIEALWKRLAAAGAFKATNGNARLDSWLLSRFRGPSGRPVREPYWLDLADADRCIRMLGAWVRTQKAKDHRDTEAQRGEEP
jgi:phage gp16-like protein